MFMEPACCFAGASSNGFTCSRSAGWSVIVDEQYQEIEGWQDMAVHFTFQKIGVHGCICGPIPKRWPHGWGAKKFVPLLNLSSGPSNVSQFSQLISYFQAALCNLHVPFDADGSFQLKDVHNEAEALSFASMTHMCGAAEFVGGGEAATVPYGNLYWPQQIRILFSWKHPGELQDMETVLQQAQLQLMGCFLHSNHPAMLVCTDGTNFALFCPWLNACHYWQTFNSCSPGYSSQHDAMRLMAYHLLHVCSRKPLFCHSNVVEENADLKAQLALLMQARRHLTDRCKTHS